MEIEVVSSGFFKFCKALSLKMKKESPKTCEPPTNNKKNYHGKKYKKDVEKRRRIKNEKYKKSLTTKQQR